MSYIKTLKRARQNGQGECRERDYAQAESRAPKPRAAR